MTILNKLLFSLLKFYFTLNTRRKTTPYTLLQLSTWYHFVPVTLLYKKRLGGKKKPADSFTEGLQLAGVAIFRSFYAAVLHNFVLNLGPRIRIGI